MAQRHSASTGESGLGWLLKGSQGMLRITGGSKGKRLEESAAAGASELSDADCAELDRAARRA